jgi:hypothetical protein
MPIHVGKQRADANAVDLDDEAGDGECLFELLGAEVRRMNPGEQLEVVTALQGGGWPALRPELQQRFEGVARDYLEGE